MISKYGMTDNNVLQAIVAQGLQSGLKKNNLHLPSSLI